jgi:hypothetical protein
MSAKLIHLIFVTDCMAKSYFLSIYTCRRYGDASLNFEDQRQDLVVESPYQGS